MIHILLLIFLLCSLLVNFFLPSVDPLLGIIINSFSIVLYILLAVYDFYDTKMQEILSISAVFVLVNLLNIYLQFSDIFINSMIIYALLFFISLIFCLKVFHEKKLFHIKNIIYILIIFPLGGIFGYAIYYFIHFSQFSLSYIPIYASIGSIVLMGITEGIFFQALIQSAVTTMTDDIIAISFTSILYGAFHFSSYTPYTLLFVLLGIVYAIIYSIWKNIYIAICLNIIINATFFFLTSHLLLFAIK